MVHPFKSSTPGHKSYQLLMFSLENNNYNISHFDPVSAWFLKYVSDSAKFVKLTFVAASTFDTSNIKIAAIRALFAFVFVDSVKT